MDAAHGQLDIVARFQVFVRCVNCFKPGSRRIDIPDAEGAPRDIAELQDSALLRNLGFRCQHCDGAIGDITGIKALAC